MSDDFEHRMKRAEIDAWTSALNLRVKQYRLQGMDAEQAEERAAADIRREIRDAPRRGIKP